jgi:primosomal protein N''
LSLDFIVNKYVGIEKRLALSEYIRNKGKKTIKRIAKDLYETEEAPQQPIEKQDKTQQPIITNQDFESKLTGIVEDNKNIEDKQSDNQPQQYDTIFKLISQRKK